MPPKKRQQKPANPQDMPAMTSTRRRTARRRCQDQLNTEENREANTSPSSSPRRHCWSIEAPPQNSPTPLADTATPFAVKKNMKIPPNGKNVRELPTFMKSPTPNTEAEDKIPSNRDINIPAIYTQATPEWHLLFKRIKAKLGKPIPASCDGTSCIQFAPATQRDYDIIHQILIEENHVITGPPGNQPRNKKPQRVLPTPTTKLSMIPQMKPPTPTPPKTVPRHIPPPRTPTPTMSEYASRDSSPTPSEEGSMPEASPISSPTPPMLASREISPARTPTPTMSANASREGSPMERSSPTLHREETPEVPPIRTPTPQMSANTSRACSPTIPSRTPTPTLPSKATSEAQSPRPMTPINTKKTMENRITNEKTSTSGRVLHFSCTPPAAAKTPLAVSRSVL
ncbi:hypothetical protein ACJJTC_016772 [Scirpophaga incertulas]